MNQSSRNFSFYQGLLFGGAIATVVTGSLLVPGLTTSVKATLEDSPKNVVDEVWQIVNNEFVDRNFNSVDWHTIRQDLLNKEYTNKSQAYKSIRKALKDLGDPYTRFLDPEEFQILTSHTSGELSGVGIRLEFDRQSYLTVVDTLKGSPAVEAGLKTGDRILRINGKPTALMTLEQATEELKGEVGTDVNLQILRKNKEVFEVKLTRAQIEVPAVSYETKQESQLRVGYIKLDEFSSHAADEIKQAIKQLSDQQVSGFVLDLRENPGGLLLASVDIARLWMQQGEIVHTIDRRGGDRKFSANGTALTDLPLVILVNENSASASEILAGALKENKRATLVGTTTYGKGTVQSVHSLSDGSGLAVTIARYYLANGTNINKKGVQPDIEQNLSTEQALALENNPALIATKNDPQYLRAVSVLRNQSIGQTPTMPKPVGIRLQNQPKNSVPGQP